MTPSFTRVDLDGYLFIAAAPYTDDGVAGNVRVRFSLSFVARFHEYPLRTSALCMCFTLLTTGPSASRARSHPGFRVRSASWSQIQILAGVNEGASTSDTFGVPRVLAARV